MSNISLWINITVSLDDLAVCNYLGLANVQRGGSPSEDPQCSLHSLIPNYPTLISTGDKTPVLKEPLHCGGRLANNKDSDAVKWKMYRISSNYLRSPEKGGHSLAGHQGPSQPPSHPATTTLSPYKSRKEQLSGATFYPCHLPHLNHKIPSNMAKKEGEGARKGKGRRERANSYVVASNSLPETLYDANSVCLLCQKRFSLT